MKKIITLFVLINLHLIAFSQNPAELENSFNINNLTNVSGGMPGGVTKVGVQSDGKIFVAGLSNSFNNTYINKIARLNYDGSLDQSFNSTGTGLNSNAQILQFLEQPDGKILIAGKSITSYNGDDIFGIVRLNNDGTRDISFNTTEFVSQQINSIQLQSDGKILVGGNFTSFNGIAVNRLTRLNSDGTTDSGFNIGNGFNGNVNSIALQSDGKIVIVGTFTTFDGNTQNRIVRLNNDGSIDATFNTGIGFNNLANSICLQPDGKILVVGNFTSFNANTNNYMVRLNPDGSEDLTFSNTFPYSYNTTKVDLQSDGKILVSNNYLFRLNLDGTHDTTFTNCLYQNDFLVLNDDKIVVGGNFYNSSGHTVNTIIRLNSDGTNDTDFALGVGFDNYVYDIAQQPDGKILVGGTLNTYNDISVGHLVRLNIDGTLDVSFDLGAGFNGRIHTVEIQSDGKILLGGNFTGFNGVVANHLVRLNVDGSLDDTFDAGTIFGTTPETTIYAIAVQSDGNILIGGNFPGGFKKVSPTGVQITTSFSPGLGDFVRVIKILPDGNVLIGRSSSGPNDSTLPSSNGSLRRYTSTGSLDGSFSSFTYNGGINDISIDENGKIIVGGNFTTVSGSSYNKILRLNANGSKDTSFIIGTGFGTQTYEQVNSVEAQTGGRILVGGTFSNFNGISSPFFTALNPDGTKNTQFNVGKSFKGTIQAILTQQDGKILVGGGFSNYNNYVVGCLARLIGGGFYNLSGQNTLDLNNDGCDVTDIPYPNMKFNFNDGVESYDFFSNTSGSYSFLLNAGSYTITPVVNSNFNVTPTSINATFPSQYTSLVQDYCLTSVNGLYNDLEINIVPINTARPGFDAIYKIVYKNKGVQYVDGIVNLTFDDQVIDYVSSNPSYQNITSNMLTWSFNSLAPQEQRSIYVTFNLNSPMETPPLNLDDNLSFTTTITIDGSEATPDDNTFTLNQLVVNSYDPNDKTCLEGNYVEESKIGNYVHYLIRFENNGTANAEFIRVVDFIDLSKFEINTLEPLDSSHPMITKISDGNKVEFFFNEINLPFDDANNDGYVLYKIKLRNDLVLNDTFENSASIYFDFNFPIYTNIASTTISNTLSNNDFIINEDIKVYPNPVSDFLYFNNLTNRKINKILMFNGIGQLVFETNQDINKLDMNDFKSGVYILKIFEGNSETNLKIIKK